MSAAGSALCMPVTMEPITTTAELAEACARMARHPFVTIDTEFLRETTYYPLLCVAQMASDRRGRRDRRAGGRHRPDAVLRADDRTRRWSRCSTPPARTSKSSGTWPRRSRIRSSTPRSPPWCSATATSISYDQLVQRITGDMLDKSHRFTDWTRRPLSRRAARLRGVRRHASARRLPQARRRSRQARPRRLGRGRDGRADLARDLPHGARSAPGSG